MSIHQIQLDRLSQKFANLANKRSPEIDPGPSMATSRPKLYTEIVQQPVNPTIWRAKSENIPIESKARLIRCKVEEIRSKSTQSNPMCLCCGSAGHLAKVCRNAQLCFVCNKFGHRSIVCRASTSIFPFTPIAKPKPPEIDRVSSPSLPSNLDPTVADPPAPDSPILLKQESTMTQLRTSSNNHSRAQAISVARASTTTFRAPIQIFTPSPSVEAAEKDFKQSFILDDVAGWGPEQVERVLHRLFDQYKWRVAVFDEFRYLIKAPSMAWKQATAKRGSLTLDGIQFPVIGWDPSLNEATRNRYDYRFARVRVGACDPAFFTEKHWMLVRNIAGYVSSFDLDIEVEIEQTESVNAWLARTPNFAPTRPPRGLATRRAPPPPPPAVTSAAEHKMDEDLLEDPPADERLKAPATLGCNESDPRDGHFTEDSDSDHDHFMKSMQHMISRGGTHGDSAKTEAN
ncbi:hypothetical protein FCM35_KLT10479 [Carex littledalei]|uniref:CCHC-type domain-containing protein n=1 Tax=Carex littledalei TaxID=544730 RepID=A0A833VJG7_9POAL|nr:hypothetical protein FCM35_KLT10479 [Carex littledalei]